jgi:type IV secretory pathway VirB2 component (pilin)
MVSRVLIAEAINEIVHIELGSYWRMVDSPAHPIDTFDTDLSIAATHPALTLRFNKHL